MTDKVRENFFPSPEHYNAPYDKRSFDAGYQAAHEEARALVGEIEKAIDATVKSSSYGYLDGRIRARLMQALTKAQKWMEGNV